MSYQVLARKWRPSSFNEVVGQQHVLQALINALEQQRLHHAYLFSGTRGVGKTSIARLLAKCLNCEVGVSATPCGQCQSCLEIEQGRFIDLIEIDAASRTKVEDTREILDNVQYKPTRGRYKVYLIDEVHMLSRSSFNALLKTLEEPPEHVKFLFATTETQKLPVTILSRCLQFNLKALSPRQIAGQLNHILTQESVGFDEGAINLLSQSAKGSMRDALSLTDQAISHGNGNLEQSIVSQMLGTIDVDFSVDLLTFALNGNAQGLFDLVTQVSEMSPDFDALLGQMIQNAHFASMAKLVPNSARLASQPKNIIGLSQFDAELLQLFYSIMIQGRQELQWASDEQSGFEMVLLRLLAFKPKDLTMQSSPINNNQIDDAKSHIENHIESHADNNIETNEEKSIVQSLESEQASILEIAQTQKKQPAGLSKVREALAGVDKKTGSADNRPLASTYTATTPESATPLNNTPLQNPQLETQPVIAEQVAVIPEPITPVEVQTITESPQVELNQTPVNQTAVNQELVNQSQFSEEELLNMSMAMANEDDSGEYYEHDNMMAVSEAHSPVAQATEQSIEQPMSQQAPPVVSTAPQEQVVTNTTNAGTDINAFLKAKNTLKNQRGDNTAETPKKSLKVIEQSDVKATEQLPTKLASVTANIESLPVVDNTNLVKLTAAIPVDELSENTKSQALVDDPALLLLPNSDDPWTLKIESMELGGRLRQFAIHSTFEQTDNQVKLILAKEHAHLNAEAAVNALTKKLSLLLALPIELLVEVGTSEEQTPYEIAQELHQHRLVLAGERIKQDGSVVTFIEQFNATLVDESIKYRTIKAIS